MFLGIDLSRRDAAAVVLKEDGAVAAAVRGALPREGGTPAMWLAAMDVAREALRQAGQPAHRIVCAGIAFEAPLDANGVVGRGPNTEGWEGFSLTEGVRQHLEMPAVADRRVWCEALGEQQFGSLRGLDDWLYVHLGTSITGAAAIRGCALRGVAMAAVELGAVCIERDGALGAYGKRGSLDAYCGGDALIARARSYGMQLPQPWELWSLAASNFAAQSLCDDFVARLAQGLGSALALLNPRTVTIGGGFGVQLGDRLLSPLCGRLKEFCLPAHHDGLRICNARLGIDAAVMGAVALAMRHTKTEMAEE